VENTERLSSAHHPSTPVPIYYLPRLPSLLARSRRAVRSLACFQIDQLCCSFPATADQQRLCSLRLSGKATRQLGDEPRFVGLLSTSAAPTGSSFVHVC
jgi:hypothetical protein